MVRLEHKAQTIHCKTTLFPLNQMRSNMEFAKDLLESKFSILQINKKKFRGKKNLVLDHKTLALASVIKRQKKNSEIC